jgi:hypothetical protein
MTMGRRLHWRADLAQAGFLLIVLLTLANGLFTSLVDEFVPPAKPVLPLPPHAWTLTRGTFLADPADVRADLIKFDFSFPPLAKPDLSQWPAHYRKLVEKSPYESIDLRQQMMPDRISGLVVPPLYVLLGMATKELILAQGPSFVVGLNDFLCFAALAGICWLFVREWRGALLTFIALGLSSPFLNVVSRGNQGALVVGVLLAGFVYAVCVSPNLVVAVLLLALACNFRPNALILAPLLWCFGWRRFLLGAPFFVALTGGLFLVTERITEQAYPGYTLAAFLKALRIYYEMYVNRSDGNVGNNSAFGAWKMIYLFFTGPRQPTHALLAHANADILLFFSGLLLSSMVLFHLKRISAFEFVFLGFACYMLTSTIFGTYHLFPFAALALLFYRDRKVRGFSVVEWVIFFALIFLLSPKDYVHVHRVSLETVLNPLAIAVVFLYVWGMSLSRSPVKRPAGDPGAESSP